MGETSSEVAARPQPVETKETGSNFGLSVNGSQLTALANLDYLEKNGFASPLRPNLLID